MSNLCPICARAPNYGKCFHNAHEMIACLNDRHNLEITALKARLEEAETVKDKFIAHFQTCIDCMECLETEDRELYVMVQKGGGE